MPPRIPGTASRSDGRPASFAGMSRIRFGGSVALATLSALEALPGGGIRLPRVYIARWRGPGRGCRLRSGRARRLTADGRTDPFRDPVDQELPARLVVAFVAKVRQDPPLDVPQTSEWRAGVGRDEA